MNRMLGFLSCAKASVANDIVINAYISVPLIDRKSTDAKVKALQGPTLSPFDEWSWNIADWTKA